MAGEGTDVMVGEKRKDNEYAVGGHQCQDSEGKERRSIRRLEGEPMRFACCKWRVNGSNVCRVAEDGNMDTRTASRGGGQRALSTHHQSRDELIPRIMTEGVTTT